MISVTLQVSASLDDGYEMGQGQGVDAVGAAVYATAALSETMAGYRTALLRFVLPTAIAGAEISSAYLQFFVTGGDDPALDIFGELAATAAAIDEDDEDNITSRSLTTAAVTWIDGAVGTGWVDGPDIADVLQELVQYPGLSGYLALVLKPHMMTARQLGFASYDDDPDLAARLIVTYEPPAPGGHSFGVYDPVLSEVLDFGSVDLGDTQDCEVTFANLGIVGLLLGAPTFTGAGSAAYSWVGGPLPGTINPAWSGGTVPVAGTIRFTPTAGGPAPAALSFTTNTPGLGTASWALTGLGITGTGGVTWKVWADWDRDGDFDDAGEDISDYVIRARWNLGMRKAWQHTADEGKCTLTVNNVDQRFSPEFTGGAYYPNVNPHVPLRVASVSDLGTVVHWTGWIREVQPAPGIWRERTAQIVAESARTYLQNTEVNLARQEDKRADEVIPVILEQTHYPPPLGKVWVLGLTGSGELGENTYLAGDGSDLWDFEPGITTFPVVDLGGKSGWDAVRALVESERGRFYYDRSGSVVFWNRHHLLKIRDNDGTVTGWQELDYLFGGEDIRNQITVTCAPREESGTVTLWSLPTAIVLPKGSEYRLEARYRNQNGGAAVAGADAVQPSAAGSTLACSQGTVTISEFTPRSYGAVMTLRNDGDEGAVISTVIIKGKRVTDYNPALVTRMDGESVGLYGRREMQIDLPLVTDLDYADSLARYELKLRATPRGRVRQVTLMGRDWGQQRQQLETTIGTRMQVGDQQVAHTADYFVLGEEHEVRIGGDHRTTWYLEPAEANEFWVVGESLLGINTYLTV